MSFRQTCKVRVTGRNLRYQRALQIVQDEEYLSAIDLDDIRRYRRKFQIKRRKWKKHVRKKRQGESRKLTSFRGHEQLNIFALCSRNFQNVKLRLDFVEI